MPSPTLSEHPVEAGKPELRAALHTLRSGLSCALGFSLVASLLALAPSWYMLEVYDRVVLSRSDTTLLMLTLAILLAYGLIQIQEWTRNSLLHAASASLEEQLGGRVFGAALGASRAGIAEGGAQSQQDLRTLREFLRSPPLIAAFELPMMLVYLVLLYAISPWLLAVTLGAALLQTLIGWLNGRATSPALREANRYGLSAQTYADRLLQNAQAVEAMGMLGAVRQRWNDTQRKAVGLQARASLAGGGWQAGAKLLQNLVGSALLGLACWLMLKNELNGGGAMLVVAGIFGGRALAPFVQIVTHWRSVITAQDAWRRLGRVLKSQPPTPPSMPLPPPKGTLIVQHVSASALGQAALVLRDIHFALQPGEVLAVIGPSGAGKSSLGRVLLGLWPTSAGKVRLDGVDIHQWAKEELGPHLGYLPQGVSLIEGTLADNIARFSTPDPDRLQVAIEAAGLHDLVVSLPEGLNTPLGTDGARLSGGQRQRIGLARAIYGRPGFVVLDEPNSSLDEAGDQALTQLIDARRRQGTTFVVMTHRTSILSVADKILLLVDGQQQAFGPRDEVLAAIRQANEQHTRQAPA
jgi:ATP-binding cassette, subfamily C, bacterial exporter for protease/lipase